ncbi:TIGR04222 domain-containing membrane protein [Saccharothrix sp. S26]|uniref:TIGR04222 domain-containing membrane protein n=1 Tax=Saccharothrix sp. S26 TaxID=2907215 RepID=UPI001F2A8305|nr:TIGR04222 domain-containing membrane protein [Saccharothrix sp. S26]MCE6999857.1 TIGR04222 domain-containing membrane protein [Saccharothrix sp. S26]
MTVATQWTPTSAGSAGSTPEPGLEEQGFLVGGPGRAAEVAVVSLVEASAARISRGGLVSAVGRPRAGTSPLGSAVLRRLPMSLGDVIIATASSAEAQSLRQYLVGSGLVTPPGRRQGMRTARRLLIAAAVATVVATIVLELPFWLALGAVPVGVVGAIVLGRAGRPLTARGRDVVKRLKPLAVSPNRIALVAYYGLLGKVERHHVWEVLGIGPAAATTLRRRSNRGGSNGGASCGGGCGSCSSSSCGGSGSDSGGSSCGGSSCGGGGCGGGGGD